MDFGTFTSDTFFWQRIASVMFLLIIGYFTRQNTYALLAGILAAVLGTDYAGVFIAGFMLIVVRILGVVKV